MIRFIDDFVECNSFFIKITNNKLYAYYYKKIDMIEKNKITINSDNTMYFISGNDLVVEKMNSEQVIISGILKNIEMVMKNEK